MMTILWSPNDPLAFAAIGTLLFLILTVLGLVFEKIDRSTSEQILYFALTILLITFVLIAHDLGLLEAR